MTIKMTYKEIIKEKLEQFPKFRERRFRAQGLLKLALREMDAEKKYYSGIPLSEEQMIEFAKIYDNYRHEWDFIMKTHPELHGEDYDGDDTKLKSKKRIEQEWQMAHGYEPNYYRDVKVLSTIN